MTGRTTAVASTLLVLAASLTHAQLQTPSDWRWRTDEPAKLVAQQKVPEGSWRFVAMPPGWHVTTGPGTLLYHPDETASGRYALEAETFLFPGTSEEPFGVFVGGQGLEGSSPAEYTAFVVRRDGQAAVIRRTAGEARVLVPWTRHEAILAHTGKGTAKNVLRVEVNPGDARFLVNGQEVATVPGERLQADGRFGFRIGSGIDLHISTLDVTRRLAPPPPPKR